MFQPYDEAFLLSRSCISYPSAQVSQIVPTSTYSYPDWEGPSRMQDCPSLRESF